MEKSMLSPSKRYETKKKPKKEKIKYNEPFKFNLYEDY